MMDSFREEDEEFRFFDAHEDIAAGSDCLESPGSSFRSDNSASSSFDYEVWTKIPQSVQERRSKFLKWMGLNSGKMVLKNQGDESRDLYKGEIDRIMENSGAILRTSCLEDEFSSSRSSMSSWSSGASDVLEECGSIISRIGNLGGGTECNADELGKKNMQNRPQGSGLAQLVVPDKFQNTCSSYPAVQQPRPRETKTGNNSGRTLNRVKSKWLNRLCSITCIGDRQGIANSIRPTNSRPTQGARVQRVKVRPCKKQSKELSALFMGQDIQAHTGSILTMKFSHDGRYLATAGEDGIVRVWQVVVDARSNENDVPAMDPSCIYFTVNQLSELAPLVVEKEKLCKLKSLKKTEDSACVIFPPRVFRILEEPLHQFHGHNCEILDLSWSNNNFLLSSSVDKTVRLWQVGSEHCLKVFPHSNYVTCVQFNPVDNNHFISGSIDGKVRIWAITGCVVDWIDTRDIITAICYHPDGQGMIVGSMTGKCRFYNISGFYMLDHKMISKSQYTLGDSDQLTLNGVIASDNHIHFEAQISLNSKKKARWKRITGFQFFPHDPSKLMVTCADSQVRILQGLNVVGKYKGLRNTGNQLFASFTSDGKHIVSTSEDSNVYVWNFYDQKDLPRSQPKIIRSWERFSINASIALPWSGFKFETLEKGWQFHVVDETLWDILPFPSPICFSLGQEFILESFPKGTATWPEEKLIGSSQQAASSIMHKSQYKFLRSSCQSTSSSHAWDLVIVTAGWDGRIRSFHNYGLPVAL